MKSPDRTESEPKEPFSRGKCIDYSLRTYTPRLFINMSEGRGFEEKFLGQEAFREQDTLIIPTVSLRIQEEVNRLISQNASDVISDRQLDTIEKQNLQEIRQIGTVIKNKAEEFSLVNTQSPEQVAQSLKDKSMFEYEVEDNSVSWIRYRGWYIYQDKEEKHILVIPNTTRGEISQLDTVDLDDLFIQDPEFLKEQINRYHQLQGVRNAINGVTYNLALHSVDERLLIPHSFEQFSIDPEKRQKEVKELATFLTWFARLDNQYSQRVYGFVTGLRQRGQKFSGEDNRSADLGHYLGHMEECPGESDNTHQQAAGRKEVYEQFTSIDLNSLGQPVVDNRSPNTQILNLFRNPLMHTEVEVSEAETQRRSIQTHDQKFVQFIEETRGIRSPEQFLQALQQKLPDTFTVVERFREWLNKGYIKDMLGEIVDSASFELGFKDLNLNGVGLAVSKNLQRHSAFLKSDFPGVSISWSDAYISDSTLRDVLSLLVIKSLHKSLDTKQDSFGFDREYKQQRSGQIDDLTVSIIRDYKRKTWDNERILSELAEKRLLMQVFIAKAGISAELIDELTRLVREPEDSEGKKSLVHRDHTSFALAFNALFFSSKGRLDISSTAFRAIVKEIFPNINDEALDVIQRTSDPL